MSEHRETDQVISGLQVEGEIYRQQHCGYEMPESMGGGTMMANSDLAALRRKAAAFDGMAKFSLALIPSPSVHSDNYSCEDSQHNGIFAPTPLEAAERMISMCEAGCRKSMHSEAKCGNTGATV